MEWGSSANMWFWGCQENSCSFHLLLEDEPWSFKQPFRESSTWGPPRCGSPMYSRWRLHGRFLGFQRAVLLALSCPSSLISQLWLPSYCTVMINWSWKHPAGPSQTPQPSKTVSIPRWQVLGSVAATGNYSCLRSDLSSFSDVRYHHWNRSDSEATPKCHILVPRPLTSDSHPAHSVWKTLVCFLLLFLF